MSKRYSCPCASLNSRNLVLGPRPAAPVLKTVSPVASSLATRDASAVTFPWGRVSPLCLTRQEIKRPLLEHIPTPVTSLPHSREGVEETLCWLPCSTHPDSPRRGWMQLLRTPGGFLLPPPGAEVFPQGCLPASAALWVLGWKGMAAVRTWLCALCGMCSWRGTGAGRGLAAPQGQRCCAAFCNYVHCQVLWVVRGSPSAPCSPFAG